MFRADLLGRALLGAAVLGAGSALCTRATAQGALPFNGAPVRVVTLAANGQPERIVRGRFILLANDSVTLDVGKWPEGSRLRTFDLHDPWQLQVSSGRHSRLGTGAVVGAVFGAVVGGIIGAASYEPSPPCDSRDPFCGYLDFGRGGLALAGAFVGGGAGSLMGLVVGSQLHTTTWVPVRASRVHITLGPAGVGLHAEF